MATVVDIIAVMKLLTTCKETIKSRGLCERLQSSINEVTKLIQAPQSKYSKLQCIFDQLSKQYFVDRCWGQLLVTNSTQPSRKLQYPQLPPNILSIQQQLVQVVGQFIVMLGLSPYLLSGVRVSLKQRTRSPDVLTTLKQLQ